MKSRAVLPRPCSHHSTEANVLEATGWSVGRRIFITSSSSSVASSTYTSASRLRMLPGARNISQYGVITRMSHRGAGSAPFHGSTAATISAAIRVAGSEVEVVVEAGTNPRGVGH